MAHRGASVGELGQRRFAAGWLSCVRPRRTLVTSSPPSRQPCIFCVASEDYRRTTPRAARRRQASTKTCQDMSPVNQIRRHSRGPRSLQTHPGPELDNEITYSVLAGVALFGARSGHWGCTNKLRQNGWRRRAIRNECGMWHADLRHAIAGGELTGQSSSLARFPAGNAEEPAVCERR